jgi:hypothetical protein
VSGETLLDLAVGLLSFSLVATIRVVWRLAQRVTRLETVLELELDEVKVPLPRRRRRPDV